MTNMFMATKWDGYVKISYIFVIYWIEKRTNLKDLNHLLPPLFALHGHILFCHSAIYNGNIVAVLSLLGQYGIFPRGGDGGGRWEILPCVGMVRICMIKTKLFLPIYAVFRFVINGTIVSLFLPQAKNNSPFLNGNS